MSRKIKLKVPVDVVVRDRDVLMLAAIDELSCGSDRSVSASLRTLSEKLGVSALTARRAIASCVEEQMLVVSENRLANGGQVENSYLLTERGRSILKAARDAEIV